LSAAAGVNNSARINDNQEVSRAATVSHSTAAPPAARPLFSFFRRVRAISSDQKGGSPQDASGARRGLRASGGGGGERREPQRQHGSGRRAARCAVPCCAPQSLRAQKGDAARAECVPAALLGSKKVVISDGGLATELENMGANLNDHLWSARCVSAGACGPRQKRTRTYEHAFGRTRADQHAHAHTHARARAHTRARTCARLYTHFGYRLLRDDPQLIYEAHLRYARARLLCWRVDRTLCAFDPALVPTAPARHLLLDRCSCVCKQCMQACADVCMHTCLRWCVRACAQAKQRSWRRWGSSTRRWRIDL